MGPDGALYVCNNGGFEYHKVRGDDPGHRNQNLRRPHRRRSFDRQGRGALPFRRRRCASPNDIVFDRQGGFWFTDRQVDARFRQWGCCTTPRSTATTSSTEIASIMAPNGVGLSPDEKTVYYAETLSSRLFSAAIAKPGKLAKGAGLVRRLRQGTAPTHAYFDSLAVQANGDVLMAISSTPASRPSRRRARSAYLARPVRRPAGHQRKPSAARP
ncbi:MAG: SMP-30/gluconolactonase/LRE family protein [Alphaproteobacteria bacterium]